MTKKYNPDDYIYESFKTKIYPTKEQKKYFHKCFGISKLAYNWFLYTKENNYRNNIKKSFKQMVKDFSNLKNTIYPFLDSVNMKVYKVALENANKAYENYFKNRAFFNHPKYKSKKENVKTFGSERVIVHSNNYMHKRILNGYNFYIGGPSNSQKRNGFFIKTSESIDHLKQDQLFKVVISYDGNDYFASFEYKYLKPELKYNDHKNELVGIDLGLKIYSTQSDGKIAIFPKKRIIYLEEKAKKFQKIMSKKIECYKKNHNGEYDKTGFYSNNYQKVKAKFNKCNTKIKNIRNDFLNKYTTRLCKNYKTIKIEDLNIRNMLKNHKLAKAISRSAWYTFRMMLNYKSEKYNNNIIVVDRFFASSKICSKCGTKTKKMPLNIRIFICPKCGLIIDRDFNAAINIANF